MQAKNILITICGQEIAPRFDMTAEVMVLSLAPNEQGSALSEVNIEDTKHLVLAHTSSEELCDLITRMDIKLVICGAIESDYFHYLKWKRIDVLCDVSGSIESVIQKFLSGALTAGDCLYLSEIHHDLKTAL